jgi:hypothetical protein
VSQQEIIERRVAALDVLDQLIELQILTQRPSDSAEATDVLGVAPPRVMPAAVGV